MKLVRRLLLGIVVAAAAACSSAPSSDSAPCDLPNVASDNCERAHAMQLTGQLAPSAGNRYADDDDAALLGFHLFFDSNIGAGITCAHCHAPELAFTDRLPVSRGKGVGTRNAPTVFNAARLNSFFWDGRADSLWSQPLFAVESTAEMASSRLELAHVVQSNAEFHADYERVFGPLPDMSTWPSTGMPGDAGFDALPGDQKDLVNRVAANVGKALDAYQRKNTTSSAALDQFLAGDATRLVEPAQRGLNVFLAHRCDSCHSGSLLSDERFYDVGFPSLPDAEPDSGRAGGVAILRANVFNLSGSYADPGPGVPPEPPVDADATGAFRTPSLRNVTRTSPYGHNGALASLADVLTIHAPGLTADEAGELLSFFETLNGDYPPKPWSNWPSPQ